MEDQSMRAIIRPAAIADAAELFRLNEEFNGEGTNALELVAQSLTHNQDELIQVAEQDNMLVGFLCARRLWSMCYDVRYAELTELFVMPAYRKQGIASALICAMELRLRGEDIHDIQLLTGKDNRQAQALYRKLDYAPTDEMMFRKRSRSTTKCSATDS
ncbi:GNAT family N-acetyltransferase [Eubacteriales bacterium OttesenSCG-928-N13]|nr:GNAT family N-acetyltransferase [Eubacteriales bacterium OttesenSCG-928-N13]